MRLRVDAFWLLLLWFGADLYQTLASHGRLSGHGGVNFVAHGVGFAFGFAMALIARLHGVMRRYETMPGWHPLFGYLAADGHPSYKPRRPVLTRRFSPGGSNALRRRPGSR